MDLLSRTYREGCKTEPEIRIHENKVNGQMYYIAETDREVDFEFKGTTLVKMWDAREERTYYPETVKKYAKHEPLKEIYDSAVRMLYEYIKNPHGYKDVRASIHKRNLVALNNIRKAENEFRKKIPALKKSVLATPPVTYKRGENPFFDHAWATNLEYVSMDYGYPPIGHRTLNEARKRGILVEIMNQTVPLPINIYKRSGVSYHFVGMVGYGDVGAYRMIYFMNKNGIFQMNGDGSLAGALYRW